MNKPNIVYLHTHDTGRSVEPYGYGFRTPAIQRLAGEGVLFRHAFSTCAICSPSRASLLTGQYPHACGMFGLAHRGMFVLDDYGKHIIHTLKKAGYLSVSCGLQHIGRDTDAIGFDHVLGETGGSGANVSAVVPRAQAFLNKQPEQPFFLDVGFRENHKVSGGGYDVEPDEIDDRYCQPPPGMPDTVDNRREMAAYKASLAAVDRGIGELIKTLESNDLLENTLIILTTDHGLAVPGHKWYLTDRGTGVMLIMRGPGPFSGGRIVDTQVSQVDLFPTLCDYLGIEQPGWLQGVSMMPCLNGESENVREEVFSEMTYHNCYIPMRSVRTEKWKYIRRFDRNSPGALSDDGPGRDYWLENGWPAHLDEEEQLYDLIGDPGEVNNLASSPDHQPVIEDLRNRLRRFQEDTGDAVLHGPVFPPSMEGITGYAPGNG